MIITFIKHGADYVSLEKQPPIATLLSEGRALLNEDDPADAHVEFGRWVDRVAHWLETEIRSPVLSAQWSALSYSGLATAGGYYDDPTVWASFRRGVQQRLEWLGQALGQSRDSGKKSNEGVLHASSATIRKVFVVHGHDEGARESIARFLEKIGFEAIILHEQASQGRTVIEKVVAHGNVGFAVVLLTPDDEGCAKGGTPMPRARQNVLIELGYFIGHLGRKHVCALKRGDVEIPSDFGGVVYETFDASGGWKQALGKELKAAGYEIDWNKVMGR